MDRVAHTGHALVAIDWGTTSLRGALLDVQGHVIEERSFARGIMTVAHGEFPSVFDSSFGDWMQRAPLALISGMAGSRQGWREAPYCECPAGFAEIARKLEWIEARRVAIVPGLSFERDGTPDVMRGEETQVIGALHLLGIDGATLVLPGTHSKWVRVAAGRIESFTTFMTGEFYALLRKHSILARGMQDGDDAFDEAAFRSGLACARRSSGLLASAFSARTLGLFGRMPPSELPSYLSGLVIGEELRSQASRPSDVIVVSGDALAMRYRIALEAEGMAKVRTVGAEAAWRGLHAIGMAIV